jgi:hypothetical protein
MKPIAFPRRRSYRLQPRVVILERGSWNWDTRFRHAVLCRFLVVVQFEVGEPSAEGVILNGAVFQAE